MSDKNLTDAEFFGSDLFADPDDGAGLLDAVRRFIGRFVAFPDDHALVAVTLWAAHAHVVGQMDSSPRLALLSPEPGSGKTRTLEVLELITPNPMPVLNASVAPIFRSIESERPTLLMDEVDAIFGRSVKSDDPAADLRALLNAGHRKGATIPRCVGPRHDVKRFPVYAAVALAGLGDLPDTLMSRSVIIRMRRRKTDERIEPFRHRIHSPHGETLQKRLAAWAETIEDRVSGPPWPEMPDGVNDRPADVWEPLLAVAEAAGGHWPDTARSACSALCTVAANREASLGVRLLADLHTALTIFDKEGKPIRRVDALTTAMILSKLYEMAESPWADLRGKPLDARGLAKHLRRYDVRSTKVRINGADPLQGYQREHFWDAWQRYLPSFPGGMEPPEHPEQPNESGGSDVPPTDAVPEQPGANGTSGASKSGARSTCSGSSASPGTERTWPALPPPSVQLPSGFTP